MEDWSCKYRSKRKECTKKMESLVNQLQLNKEKSQFKRTLRKLEQLKSEMEHYFNHDVVNMHEQINARMQEKDPLQRYIAQYFVQENVDIELSNVDEACLDKKVLQEQREIVNSIRNEQRTDLVQAWIERHQFQLKKLQWDEFENCLRVAEANEKDINWHVLSRQFINVHDAVYHTSKPSVLEVMIQAGTCVLSTPHCGKDHASIRKDRTCPICEKKTTTKGLPGVEYDQSRLYCPVSGEIMDASNPPMALPNGHVQSRNTMDTGKHGKPGKEIIKCHRTGQEFHVEQAKTVFII